MSSTWGEHIRISIFGGSHTEAIGVNMDGLPAGEAIDWEQVLAQMARRAPGQDPTATRRRCSAGFWTALPPARPFAPSL